MPGANIGIAPHSLRAVTPDELAAIVPLAEGGPVHIHAAEQIREVEECIAWSGRRPVEWLLEHAPVDQRWCLIHATHTTATEIAALASSGAVAGLCPITEASLGDGIFPTREFLDAGGRFGVGTDSNVLVGVADELRQLEYGQRLKHRERNVLSGGPGISTGRALFDAALAGGAQALAQPVVGLQPGARADIVTLDTTHPSLAGRRRDAVLDGWIFAAGAGAIALCVGGRKQGRRGWTPPAPPEGARQIQRSRAEARGMSLSIDRDKLQASRQADAVQADPARHRAPHPDRRMAAGSSHPVRAPTDDALWLLANDGEQGAVGTGASRSHRAAAAGRHICAPSQIPVGGPDRFQTSARRSPRSAAAMAIS